MKEGADNPVRIFIQTIVIVAVLVLTCAPCIADWTEGPPTSTPTFHVVCAVPCSGVVLWEGDAARADYADGEWTICPTSEPCAKTETRVRTSAPCVGKFDVWPGVPVWMGADTEAEFRANPRNVFVAPLEWTPGNPTADLSHVIAAVERIDAEHPLPHPGYRAGQVWLVAFGASWDTITVLQARNQHLTGLSFHSARVFVPAGAFLLHDPLMPSKAPWGPS